MTLARPARLDKNLRQTEPVLTHSPFENPTPYHYSAVLLLDEPMTAVAHAIHAIDTVD
jgi:hypothetical protein